MSLLYYFRAKSCVIGGTKYTRDSIVVCTVQDDLPMFGKIIEFIITPHQDCYFILYPLITQTYNHHFHAYEVVIMDEPIVLSSKKLFDYHPLVCTKPVGYKGQSLFVSLKYHLFL